MKTKLKNVMLNNWLFIFMVLAIQLKSMLLLSMLRTPMSRGIDLKSMYFGVPVLTAHIAIITLIFSVMYFFKDKGKLKAAVIIDIIITLLFIFDIWYYRNNGTFISIRHLLHPEIFNPKGTSLLNFAGVDLLFLIDFIILFAIYRFNIFSKHSENTTVVFRILKAFCIFIISFVIIGLSHYSVDIKQNKLGISLFRLSWAPFQTFSDMSPLGYHGYDISYFSNKNIKLSDSDKKDVDSWFNDNKESLKDNEYKGMLKGKNVIAIQVESLENFVINQKVNGQEITPTINKLASEGLYFNNIYEQNNSGTSSDADLLVNTSILPVREGAAFIAYPWTKYNTLQMLLNKNGYTTISSHAELLGSWNWAEPHTAFEAKKLWDLSKYNIDEKIGPGLSDESYLKQTASMLKDEKQPYYTFIATLTSHGPFDMPKEKRYLNISKELDENMLGGYFQSVRYTDEAIKLFLEELDKNGQLDDTVVMIYGDHGGVHKFYEDKIQNAPLEGDWWKPNDKKIPFIIYNKGMKKNAVISNAGGQSDFLPTISYLLGIDRSEFESSSMGRVLVNTNKNATILNNGDIMGTTKNEQEEKHLKDSFKIADLIIKGNYFKNK